MNIKKSMFVASATSMITIGSIATFGVANARVNHPGQGHQMEHSAERVENRLDKAVKSGKITAEQKPTIEAKLQELKDWHKTLKDMTPEQRQDDRKRKMAELKKWAENNKTPAGLLLPHRLNKK